MNKEINYIINKGKAAKNKWENDDTDFFWRYAVYIKIRTTLFLYLQINLFKERYISSAKNYKYLNKVIS